MAIYYQHIGRDLWARDAPKSIADSEQLCQFTIDDLEDALDCLGAAKRAEVRTSLAGEPFQIWGLPAGASQVLRHLTPGDHLLLLESEDFRYVGRVIHYLGEPCWELSLKVWSEQRFPLIVLLQGALTSYPWVEFVADFGFASNYHMRGNTCRLADERVAASRFGSELAFIKHLQNGPS